MNMVFHSADYEGLTIKIRQDAAEIAVQFFAEWFVAEKWVTVFG